MKNLKSYILLLLFVCAVIPAAAQQKTNQTKSKIADPSSKTPNKKSVSKPSAAENKPFLSAMETAVIEEINQARQNPQKFVIYLEEYKKSMKGNVLYLPNQNGVVMNEGAAVIDDAISDLKKLSKLNSYLASEGIFKAANLQLADLQENSALSHKGKDGSDVEIRLFRFGMPGINFAENISYKALTARDIVMNMILDDGVKNRPHRKNVFSSKFNKIGVACGIGNQKDMICVAVFADTFVEKKLGFYNFR